MSTFDISKEIADWSSLSGIHKSELLESNFVEEISGVSELNAAVTLASSRSIKDHRWETLATLMQIYLIKRKSCQTFSAMTTALYENIATHCGKSIRKPKVSDAHHSFVMFNEKELNKISNRLESLEHGFSLFGLQTLERGYLMQCGELMERPVYMFLRVAIGICMGMQDAIREIETLATYLLRREFMLATPILFNCGAFKRAQLASCFLVPMTKTHDTINGWFETLLQCATISHMSGGIGMSIHDIRSKGAGIDSGSGQGGGIVPLLQQFNTMIKAVDQGGGKRRGSCAIYMEPHHADIMDFLELRLTHGSIDKRTHDLFLAMWVSDLFMKRVYDDEPWSLFCPSKAPGLSEVYGAEFDSLYLKYESEKIYERQLKARDVWDAILRSQANTGMPYMLFKDHCNKKSNHSNRGCIRSSNLCAEIIQYTDDEEIAVCNLSSVCLPKFVKNGKFDFVGLYATVCDLAKYTDKIIDITEYPVERAKKSNIGMRPIGIGIQGLFDTFVKLDIAYGSEEALTLDRNIHATIYHAAITTSNNLAKDIGPYKHFDTSPTACGLLQFDLWNEKAPTAVGDLELDWITLKKNIREHGLRNSLSIALMPTASTSQIAGNSESFEAPTGILVSRRTISGDHIVINAASRKYLSDRGKWDEDLINLLRTSSGSVQKSNSLTDHEKLVLRTAWEIPGKTIIEHAAIRGPFVCQSQSMNICMKNVNSSKLNALHFTAWKKGLKTGMYYLRTEDPSMPIAFTAQDSSDAGKHQEESKSKFIECESCSA